MKKKLAREGTSLQLSARDGEGRSILSVLAKRTYTFSVSGGCVLADQQAPLNLKPIYDEATGTLLEADADIWPFKPLTDVVVQGHAYNHPGRSSFPVGVRVERAIKLVQVCGDRRASVGAPGQILFSNPTVIDELPLSYAFAYGGRDVVAEAAHGNPAEYLRPYLPPETTDGQIRGASPFVYPKNPIGRGYLVEKTAAAVEAAQLPNLEDPGDPLTPERLVAGHAGRWPAQPVPASLGWMDYGAFPRTAWLGVIPVHDESLDTRHVGEVRLGYVAPDILRERPPTEPLGLHGANGASLGLRFPHLSGGEEIELLNVCRSLERVRFHLPLERPELWVDGRNGKLAPTTPVIHAVVVEPDHHRLSVTWRGCAPALRPYGRDEIREMPFAAAW